MAQIQIVFFLLLLTSLGSSQRYPRFLGFGSSSNTEKVIPSLPPPPQLPHLPQLAAHLNQLFQQKPIVYNVRYIERTPDLVNQNQEQRQIPVPVAVPVSLPVPASPPAPVALDEISKPTERVYLNIYGQGNHGQPYYDRVTGQVLVPCPYYNHQIGPNSNVHASSELQQTPAKPVVQITQAKKQMVRQKPVVVGSTVPYPDYYQQLYQQQQQYQQQQYQPFIYVDPYYQYMLKNLYGQTPYSPYGQYPGISSVIQHSVHPPVVQVPRERERERIVSVQDEQIQVKPTDITKEPQDDE